MSQSSLFEYKPSDEEILASVRGHSHSMTYVIANRISMAKKQPVYTAFILRRMKAMEKAGLVKRVKSSYEVQICWSAVIEGGAQ